MGFPSRISRTALGAVMVDRRPIKDPTRELGARWVNLVSWQVAGAGVVVPTAKVLVDSTGALLWAAESWDADGNYAPTCSRVSTGVYQVVYAVEYPDDEGTLITTNLRAAKVTSQSTSIRHPAQLVAGDARTVDITIRDSAGAVIDCPFLLEVH